MKKFGISYQNVSELFILKYLLLQAVSFAIEKRPIVDPNEGFLKQLEEFDKGGRKFVSGRESMEQIQ
jgi:hypothetical protein